MGLVMVEGGPKLVTTPWLGASANVGEGSEVDRDGQDWDEFWNTR